MAKLVLTKDPSHKGYYQDPDGNLYVFRFGGKPIKVDGYREDKPRENIGKAKVEVEEEKVIDHTESASESDNKEFNQELEKNNDGKSIYNYEQEFHLNAPVGDMEAAQEYLSSDDMTQYLPDELKEAVNSVEWKLDDDGVGHVETHTNRELTSEEQDKLNDWIQGQNSDGLGEGFEQQDFANSYWNPETGDGPYTYGEAEQEIDDMISNVDESEYADYIDESEIEAAIDTYLESNDSVQQWKEDFWNDDIQEGLIQYQSTDDVKSAVESVIGDDIPSEYEDDVYSYIEEAGIKESVAEEIWQNLASYEQADFVAGFDQGDDMRNTARDEVLSDPESWVSDDAIYEARLAYAEDHFPTNIDDWGAMSSIRSYSESFNVKEIKSEEPKESSIQEPSTKISTHSEEEPTPGKAINFDRTHPTFKYTGSYSDNDMRTANEYSKQIQNLGDYVLDQYEKGNITYDKAYDMMEVSTSGKEGINAGLGFYHIRNNNLMRDTLYNTEAGNELINQMSYYKDNLEEMHKRFDLTVYDKGDYSSFAIKDKRYEILDESNSAFGTELYKLKDDEGNIFYKPKDEVYRKTRGNESLQSRYAGTIASLQADHPDWTMEKIMEKIRKIDED